MPTTKKASTGNLSDGQQLMRAWHYVMNVIYHNPNSIVQLPSSRALATMLGMSRSTVNLAFKKLLENEYIVCRHGSGTYTNPKRSFALDRHFVPLIGVSFLEGDAFYYDNSALDIISAIGKGLCENGYNIRIYQNGVSSQINSDREFQFSCMDALIAFNGLKHEAKQLFEKIPLVMVDEDPLKGIPSIQLSKKSAINRVLSLCKTEKCEEIAVLRVEYEKDELIAFGKAIHAAQPSLRLHIINFLEPDAQEKLNSVLAKGHRMLMLHYNRYAELVENCRQHYSGVVPFSFRRPAEKLPYHGYCMDYPWDVVTEKAIALLEENMADRTRIGTETVDAEITRWTGSEKR